VKSRHLPIHPTRILAKLKDFSLAFEMTSERNPEGRNLLLIKV